MTVSVSIISMERKMEEICIFHKFHMNFLQFHPFQIGAQTLASLDDQRSTIQRSRNRMADTEADLGQSGKVLNVMVAR